MVSGRGEAVAVATGSRIQLGRLSRRLQATTPKTGFEQGITRFGLLLTRVTALLTAAILVVNIVLGRPVVDSVLFSLALAVGLAPQLLPAIVAVSLATGARRMARQRVIVRRLDAIQDFGAMNLLCTDKTGTLTEGLVRLHAALDPTGRASALVAAVAAATAASRPGSPTRSTPPSWTATRPTVAGSPSMRSRSISPASVSACWLTASTAANS